jgi:ATP-binding cassette subfamily F protein 3
MAIVGPNGAGKSTFCRIITGQEEPNGGEHSFGLKVATSFFSQNHADELDPTKTVLDTVTEVASRESAPYCRNLLGCFLFRGDDVFKKVGVLSGGERSRVALVRMLVAPANFLILDEPTNHLDMQSQEVLQRALADYAGTVMIVSHNRAFLDPVVHKTLEFRPGEDPRLFQGNITYYLEKTADEKGGATLSQRAAAATAAAEAKANPGKPVAAPSRKDQKRIEAEQRQLRTQVLKPLEDELVTLEKRIADLEAAQANATADLSKPEVVASPAKFRLVSNTVEQVTQRLESSITRWEELTVEIEQVKAKLV